MVWGVIQQIYGLSGVLSSLSSVVYLRKFTPLQLDSGYKRFQTSYLKFIHQLTKEQRLNKDIQKAK